MLKKIIPFLIIVLVCLPLLIPLAQTGFFKSDDGGWMVIRLSAFHETLKTGQFPVRFLERLNHGYGYPVTNFLYPLPFYLGEMIHLLGFNFINSVKIMFGLSFIGGAIAIYLWTRKIPAALIYSYFLYRITDVYQRGSLGESVAFIFAPLVFYFIDRKNIPLAALSLAALICSHNSLALLFLPVIIIYSLINSINLINLIISVLLALGLSAFFWLPALYDLQYTKALTTQVASFQDYFLSNWLMILEILVPAGLALILLRKKAFFWSAVSLVALFFALPISSPFWQILPLPKLIQFPWRFLGVAALSTAVLGGMLTHKNKILGIALCVIFVIFGLLRLKVDRTFEPDSYYQTNDDTTTVKNEYMPKWVTKDPTNKPVSMFQINGNKLQLNKVYFPGIKVLVNGKSVPIDYKTNGFLLVDIPGSQDDVQIKFEETNLHKFANALTLVSLVICAFILINKQLWKKSTKNIWI